jgi:hypothetical protein|tara:strand:- start:274 stop:537 length:264 start_codon:yes stop_codon:yes gene_type:complete
MITEEDKDEFIGRMRGLAFTEDDRYETKAKELLNELINEIKSQTLPIDIVAQQSELLECDNGCDWYSVGHQLNGHQQCRKCGKQKSF